MLDPYTELLFEAAHQCRRTGGTTDHQALQAGQALAGLLHVLLKAQPHGRNAGREGDTFLFEQSEDTFTVQAGTGQHQLGAYQGRRIR
ncbi:hypothetical protein D3C79_838040 [compost metagenome]